MQLHKHRLVGGPSGTALPQTLIMLVGTWRLQSPGTAVPHKQNHFAVSKPRSRSPMSPHSPACLAGHSYGVPQARAADTSGAAPSSKAPGLLYRGVAGPCLNRGRWCLWSFCSRDDHWIKDSWSAPDARLHTAGHVKDALLRTLTALVPPRGSASAANYRATRCACSALNPGFAEWYACDGSEGVRSDH